MKTKKRPALLAAILILAIFLPLALLGLWLSHPALAGWWPDGGTAWLNRKQLTLSNNSGGNLNANAVVTITVDTQSLYTLGKLKSDCSDLRILYHPSAATNKELTRYVGFPSGTTCTTSTASKVSFALQASLSNSSNTTDYYLYYNNPDATAPTNNQTAFSVGASTATFVCPFDNSSTCLAAGTTTPTTETGAVRYSGSKSALSFDGAGDYITTGNIGSDIKTVEFWVYPTSTTNYFVDLNGSAYISASGGTLSATGFTSPVYYVNGVATSTITANSWQHIAVTTTTAINASSTNIGKIASTYLAGYMDELRISSSIRYSAAFTTSTAPYVRDSYTKLLYHFEENGDDPRNTGKTIDDSGNGYHGTITGAKYVAGLVGVDTATTTTNKITNPSFENATAYDTNWLSLTSFIGTGADGAISLTAAKNLNTTVIGSSRSTYADGIAYRVIAPSDSATSVTRYSGSDTISNGLAANDEVLLINLQGASGDTADVGNYEFKIVSSVSSSTITFTSAITKSFDGTTASNQKVIIQRVPQYTNVTLTSSGSITASAWDALATTPTGAAGYLTGVVAFRANGTVSIGSGTSITANSLGFRGGAGSAPPSYSTAGEGYAGTGSASESSNLEGGGGGLKNTDAGLRGTGAAGGGYGTAGAVGGNCTANCPTNPADSTGAPATSTYGTTALTTLFFGSGGGGNQDNSSRAGGKAGGIIFIGASTISNSGTISSNGAVGANYDSRMGGAGGGAGGSIFIASANPTLGTTIVTATGGNGGTGYSDGGGTSGAGGNGGVGRIRVEYTGSLSGTTSPAASTSQLTSNLTVTQNTTTPYYKYGANSAKIVASADGSFTTSTDAEGTTDHTLSAYVYNGTVGAVGGTVDATVAKLIYNGTAQTTTYTDTGSGWWRLSYTAAGINGLTTYGVQVLSGKTVYVDGVQLESGVYATTYTDGSLGTGYSWAGTASNSISTSPTTTNTGNTLRQSYAGHEGVTIEEATTNKITNPSFENVTAYNTNWTVQTQPSDVSGLGLWLKADALSLNDGDSVSSWTDSSGNTNPATQATGSKQPIYKTNIVNGMPVVRFQGTDDALNPSSFTHNEWFVVANITQNGNFNPTLSTADGGNRYYLMTGSNSTIWYTGGASYDAAANTTVRKDGATYAADAITGAWHVFNLTGLSETNAPQIGWGSVLNQYGVVDIAEIVAFNSAISSSNRLAIEKYLADKYAVTVASTNGIVIAKNTSAPYYKFGSSSIKVDTTNNAGRIVTSINPGNTNTHMLSAYVYDGTAGNVGGTIDATVAKLVYRGSTVTTTYTDMGGGWWRLSYSAAAANAAENYGVSVSASKVVYVDGVQLEEKAYATTYADGTLGTGYAWTGTANNSTSTRTVATLGYSPTSNINLTAGTISLWAKTSYLPSNTTQIAIRAGGTSSNQIYIKRHADGTYLAYISPTNSVSEKYVSNSSPTADKWAHLAITYTNGGSLIFYVNGSSASVSGITTPDNLSNIYVGSDTSTWDGSISDVRIYNAVLSANDVSDLYYSGLVGHSENIAIDRFGGGDTKGQEPLATWHMDEGYGTTVNDSSRNSKPLTASGATWESGIGNARSSRARYLKFDGSTSYLSRAQDGSFDFGTGSFSASGWFHHNSTAPASGTHTILARYGSAGFKVYMNTSGYVCFGIDADSTWSPADTACSGASDGSLADSKWHHVEAVKTGTTSISLYIDGHLAQTTTVTATGSMNTASSLYLGVDSTGNTNYWNGWLDEFMVYPYARSAAQVKTDLLDPVAVLIGSSANDPLSNGLVGYWKMDESSGNAADSSGNGYTLTNNATATFTAGKFANAGSLASASSQYFNTATNMGNVQTTSFWVNPTSTTTYLIDLNGTQTITAAGTIAANSITGSTIYVNGVISSTITANVWQHVVVTSTTAYAASAFAVGKVGANYLNGTIDDVRIYNRALTPKEIRDLYNWAPGPVGYWNMDEGSGATANDVSGNGATGTATGTTIVTGKFGKARQFTASDNVSATIANPAYFNTIETWIYPTTSVASKTIITTSKLTTDSSSRPVYGGCTGTALTLNQWTHISAVSTDSTHCYLYQNGVQTATGGTGVTFGTAVGIGQTSFLGKLDDVKIYNYARSSAQIQEDMQGNRQKQPIGYWKLDEGADNTCAGGANDACNSGSVGSALDGPETGMSVPATATSGWTNSGKFGKGLLFDGSDDKIAIPDNSYFTLPGDFTIDAWIKTTASGGTILGSYTNTGDIYWQFENSGGHPQLLYKATTFGATQSILGAGKLINDGAWHHVAGMRSGSTLYTYVDGVLDNTATGKLTTSINPVNPTNIGNSTTGPNYFTGTIDEVKLYHYALTADEIKLDYNRGSTLVLGALSDNSSYQPSAANQEYCVPGDTTSCVSPVGEWKFDEGTGSSALDSSGGNGTGTITGTTYVPGKVGKALNFNGSTDTVTVSNSLSTKSVEFWVYPTTTTQNLIDLRTDATAASVSVSSGTIAATGFTSPTIYVNGIVSSTLVANSWQYVAITTGTAITANAIRFGRISTTSLTGKLDAIRIFDYARTSAQIAWDYNRGGPVAQYKLDECTGATAYDASGNSINGTITIGASGSQTSTGICGTSTTTEAWNNGTTGKRNASINLDGNDDYVTTSAFSPLATAAQTTTKVSWGGWFYPTSSATSLTLMEKASEFRLTTDANSKPVCGVNTTSSATLTLQPDPTAGIDNMVAEGGQANNNYGTITVLYNQNNAGTQTYNLFKFDLSSIPAGATITSATMTLWTNSTAGTGNLKVYRILSADSAWTEAGATWNYAVASSTRWAGDTGNDGGSDAGGSVSGTDHSSTLMGSVVLTNGEAANTQKDITLDTTEFAAMLANNYGLYARKDSGGYGIFYSSDYTTDTTKRPKLVVNYTTSSFHDSTAGSTALTTSGWNHVMCTYDGANIKTYLNGSLVGTTAETNSITAASSILYMGENSSGAQRVTGQLDDLRVYTYPLTITQIKTLMNEGAVRFSPSTGSP